MVIRCRLMTWVQRVAYSRTAYRSLRPRVVSPTRQARLFAEFISNPWALLACKATIGLVSAFDIYLTIKYFESLPTFELNPIGRWLMALDEGPDCHLSQIAGFIASKFAGNFAALTVIEFLVRWKLAIAGVVAFALAVFQLGLLYFLLFATHA